MSEFNRLVINSLDRIENNIDHITEQIDKIRDGSITKKDCKKNQELCVKNIEIAKKGITPKLITAIVAAGVFVNQIIEKIANLISSS